MTKELAIYRPQWLSYMLSGKLLYASLLLFVAESLFFWFLLEQAYIRKTWIWFSVWVICFGFSFIHIFLVIADGWSRYQNYKRVKDQLFLYGFDRRIAAAYMSSKCQRSAALTAAEEIGCKKEMKDFFYSQGYRWYHWIPDFMLRDPLFIIRPYFWKRTFLEHSYDSKVDYRQVQASSSAAL